MLVVTFVVTFVGIADWYAKARGDVRGYATPQRSGMEPNWPLSLTIDARGDDSCWARIRGEKVVPHLAVRTGPVIVYCLDATSVTGMAGAWARAEQEYLAALPVTPSSPPNPLAAPGYAIATAQAVAEGLQRWDVVGPRPEQPFVVVSSDWLTVRVHDTVALRQYSRAWSEACALGFRVFPRAPLAFNRLREQERNRLMAIRYPEHQRNRGVER